MMNDCRKYQDVDDGNGTWRGMNLKLRLILSVPVAVEPSYASRRGRQPTTMIHIVLLNNASI